MAIERYGSKTDVVVKLVLVFFISLLSFSIGTFVGKKFSDNQHKLAALEPGHANKVADSHDNHGEGEVRGLASVSPDATEVKVEKALNDEDIAKLAEEFITDDKPQGPGKPADESEDDHSQAHAEKAEPGKTVAHEAPAAAHAAPAVAHAEVTKAVTQQVLKPAARMAEGRAAVVDNPAQTASRIPSSLPKEVASSAIGKFTVQVASYGTEKEAQALAADLKSKGFSAFYVSAKVKGQTWYRVSVGLFSTTKEAESYKADLVSRAKVSSAIVQKITSAE